MSAHQSLVAGNFIRPRRLPRADFLVEGILKKWRVFTLRWESEHFNLITELQRIFLARLDEKPKVAVLDVERSAWLLINHSPSHFDSMTVTALRSELQQAADVSHWNRRGLDWRGFFNRQILGPRHQQPNGK